MVGVQQFVPNSKTVQQSVVSGAVISAIIPSSDVTVITVQSLFTLRIIVKRFKRGSF
jgi:hypothetical protein